MNDPIFTSFLRRQFDEGLALARESDVLDLMPMPGSPPFRYVAAFRGRWLVNAGGEICEHPFAVFGIQFPANYLRLTEPAQIATVLEPDNLWHPNIAGPFVCLGATPPGTGLVDLLYALYEVLAFYRFSPHSPLSEPAAQWARNQPPGRFPIDRRPLRRAKEVAA